MEQTTAFVRYRGESAALASSSECGVSSPTPYSSLLLFERVRLLMMNRSDVHDTVGVSVQRRVFGPRSTDE